MINRFTIYLCLLCCLGLSCNNHASLYKRSTIIMGTTFEVQVENADRALADQAINAVFSEAKRIEQLFSLFLNDNSLAKINNSESEEIEVDDETFQMFKKSHEFWKLTGGTFDVTIGSLVDLIGFDRNNPAIPEDAKLQEALLKTGAKHIELIEPNIVKKPRHIKINFNACIPGYAADRAAKILNEYGIKKFLVNSGGEIFNQGKNWEIGIQHPRREDALLYTIAAEGKGIATSGDYQKYFKKGQKRYSHIINPLTGYPADECEAVTVIAADAITADAMSTGLFVMKVKNALETVEKLPDMEALLVDNNGEIHMSSGFEQYIVRK